MFNFIIKALRENYKDYSQKLEQKNNSYKLNFFEN